MNLYIVERIIAGVIVEKYYRHSRSAEHIRNELPNRSNGRWHIQRVK